MALLGRADVRRALRAFFVAPLAAPVLYWAWGFAAGLADGADRRHAVLQAPLRELAAIVAFGAPVAYAATLVALVPGWPLLRLRGRRAPVAVGLVGAAIGVATAVVLRPHLGSDLFRVALTPAQGAVLGGVSSFLFWWLWTRSYQRAQ